MVNGCVVVSKRCRKTRSRSSKILEVEVDQSMHISEKVIQRTEIVKVVLQLSAITGQAGNCFRQRA